MPEPTDELFDGSGCPHIRDTDKDGIPDEVDACPTVPGEPNDDPKKNGCPATGPKLVELSATGIKILERVEFATGKDTIQGDKSFKVLDAVAAILNSRKDITSVEVQGHTDNAGIAVQNTKLSQKRAEAVVKYLTKKGIGADRLVPKGYGPDKPIDDNKTAVGPPRRTGASRFVILKSATGTGAPAAAPGAGTPVPPPPPGAGTPVPPPPPAGTPVQPAPPAGTPPATLDLDAPNAPPPPKPKP